jgi:hypothetical protein
MKAFNTAAVGLLLFSEYATAQLRLLPANFRRDIGHGLVQDLKSTFRSIYGHQSEQKSKKTLVKRSDTTAQELLGEHPEKQCVLTPPKSLEPYVIPPWILNTSSIIFHPTSTRSVSVSTTKGASSTQVTTSQGVTTSQAPPPPPSPTVPSSPWKVKFSMAGESFFDGWNFWSYDDPTHGAVLYTDRGTAQSNGLIDINDEGNAIMRVETTQNVPGNRNRMSVRIESKNHFTGGLLIADIVHMPHGCGTWPAWWTNGPPVWPYYGEIDILEGVHAQTINMASTHTKPGCTIPADFGASAASSITDPRIGLVCDAIATNNIGCGQYLAEANTYGQPFNDNGGGVYAMLWDDTGIRIYFWPRGGIPDDIANKAPQPSQWGLPSARWPASQCNPWEFFKDHVTIFDTTLCGDWAGRPGSWGGAGIAGQGQSCAASTGVSTCEEYVRNNGDAFRDAYWEVKSVTLYQLS